MTDQSAVMPDMLDNIPAKPVVSFFSPEKRLKKINLDYPVMVDGRKLASVVLKRMSARDVIAYMQTIEKESTAARYFPIYFDEAGNPLSADIIEALEYDDYDKIDREALDFLPQKFRATLLQESGANDTGQGTGDSIEPLSAK